MEGIEVMGGSDRDTLCLPFVYSVYRGVVIISYVVRNTGGGHSCPIVIGLEKHSKL